MSIDNSTGPALRLLAEPGRPPLAVNATASKATNLDADKLDGNNYTSFFSGDTYDVQHFLTGGSSYGGSAYTLRRWGRTRGGGYSGLSGSEGVVTEDRPYTHDDDGSDSKFRQGWRLVSSQPRSKLGLLGRVPPTTLAKPS